MPSAASCGTSCRKPGLLVNVSNDGWFGDSIAPHQHLQMARFRALESGRFMLRSTNTGITAVIDPRGTIVGQGEQFKAVVVTATVQPRTGATPWVRFGNWPGAFRRASCCWRAPPLYPCGPRRQPEAAGPSPAQ